MEEAIQTACKRFVDKAEGISAPGQVYVWIRTTAHRVLSHQPAYERHEIPVDPTGVTMQTLVSDESSPERELIAGEDEADLEKLAQEVSSSLSERRRDILALHFARFKRPEIAAQLDLLTSASRHAAGSRCPGRHPSQAAAHVCLGSDRMR